jgi:hypothetical protein
MPSRRIKTVSKAHLKTTIGVVRRPKSRFPRLLERLKKRETEWSLQKGVPRFRGRCATGIYSSHAVQETRAGPRWGSHRFCFFGEP